MSKYTSIIPDNFAVHELVPRAMYERYGDKAILCLDPRIIRFLAIARPLWGVPLTVNNYGYGGDREWSTLRTTDSPWYNPLSQHSFGRALDAGASKMSAEEMREWIRENAHWLYNEIGTDTITIEDGVDWLHIDFRVQPETIQRVWEFTV